MDKVIAAIERHPARAFLAFAAVHATIWTVLPAVFFLNLPLDLIEALVYGREWQLGYDKLPPLPWWMVEATYRLFGPDLFFYLLSQVAILSAFALIWSMGRRLVGTAGAAAAILIIDGLHFFTFTAPKFNHDVAQLPFWALAGVAYSAALRNGRMLHWVLMGFAGGMALWAKYFVVVLAIPLGLFLLIDRDARKALRTPGPYAAAAVALVVMSPHLIWLVQNDFLPFAYADHRALHFHGALDYLTKPSLFLRSQLAFLLPSLLIAAPYLRRDARTREIPAQPAYAAAADAFDRRIVTLLAFGPAVTVVLLSIASGRAMLEMWGYPLWLFLGLWLVMQARALERVTLWRIVFLWGVVSFCYAAAFVVAYDVSPRIRSRYVAVLFPGQQLGQDMSRRFRAMTGKPLAYVIGTMWAGGNIGHYAPEHPRTLIDGSPSRAPWIDLGDLRSRGAVVAWIDGDPAVMPREYRAIAEDAEIQPGYTLRMLLNAGEITVGWAVLRPRPVVAGATRSP